MSLIMLAANACLAKSIKGKTLAGDNVLESDPTALHINPDGNPVIKSTGPFILLYAHSSKGQPSDQGLGLMSNGLADFVIQTGVTAKMTGKADDAGNSQFSFIDFAPSSRNMDISLNLLNRQIRDAILADDVWPNLFRAFINGPATAELDGIISADDGQRLAARQLTLKVNLLDEPDLDDLDAFFELRDAPDVEGDITLPDVPFARFVWLLSTSENEEDQTLADEIVELLGGSPIEWDALAQRLGFTPDEMGALGLGPLDPDDPDLVAGDSDVTLTQLSEP